MTLIMNATDMTDGQIEVAVNKLRDAMRKHCFEITSEVAEQVLGIENLGMMLFSPFRERAENLAYRIVRRVRVDRSRSPQEALDATHGMHYKNRMVVDTIPRGEGDEAEIVFFKPDLSGCDRSISNDNLEKEFELRGLKPSDPISVAAVNEVDPDFADKIPHVTHWKDADGNWCYAAFYRLNDERWVIVDRCSEAWDDSWWFAGVRK